LFDFELIIAGFKMKAFGLIFVFLYLGFSIPGLTGQRVIFVKTVKAKKSDNNKQETAEISRLTKAGFTALKSSIRVQTVKEYIDSAVLICEKKNIEVPATLHLLIAEYDYTTGDFRGAIEEGTSALKLSESSGDSETIARSNLFLAKYSRLTGYYKESIDYYNSSIAISKKAGLNGIIPASYRGEADVFLTVNDMSGYRENLSHMVDAALAEYDTIAAATGYSLLGTSFCGDSATSSNRNFKMADSLLRKAVDLSTKINYKERLAFALANMGWNFYLEKMYDTSLIYYNKSLAYSIPDKNFITAANSLGNIGTIYRDLDLPGKAIDYYNKAIGYASENYDIYDLRWIYQDMSNLYLKSRDTSNAFKNYVLFKKYSDIYLTREKTQGLANVKLKYDADTHAKEVQLLSLRLKNNRLLNYGLTVLVVLIITIGWLLYRSSQLRNKRRISEMNRKIAEVTQANLRQQMNPHFIFNTLNSIQYYMYQHDKLATNNYLTKFSNLMRKVLDNSQHTAIPLSDELNALNLYLDLERIRFKDKFDYKINVDEEIDPLMYKVPTMLMQPYVENSICHGLIPMEGKGFVGIDIKLTQDHLLCTIEDNGIGREASMERNNKKGLNHNSLGTQITSSRLDLVNTLYGTNLNTRYTDLKNEVGEAVGTRVEINIPIIS
jgi:tetratricopeptide (TPR) repeat protein